MSFIQHIPYDKATGKLKALYDRIKGPNDYLDNILTVHGLRPHSLEGHMSLYKRVLHHADNALPTWLLEAIGVYVSALNDCAYCFEHHRAGMARQLGDATRAAEIDAALQADRPEQVFRGRELAIMAYAKALTLQPGRVVRPQVEALRAEGLSDGEILEVNQVTAYFAYANRTVLGLGVDTQGDILGLSPSDQADPDAWHHR